MMGTDNTTHHRCESPPSPEPTMTDALAQQIASLIPESLEHVIRTNRDRVRLYESTEEELAALHGSVERTSPTGVISQWSFITLYFVETHWPAVYLVGYNAAERSYWMTSMVVAIDGDAVNTKSGSLYLLEGERSTTLNLPYICATLHRWGVGKMFGVPEFFF